MVTVAIALGCVALFPLAGLAIGLGGERFWWLVERVILAMIALFMGGVVVGEKLNRRKSNVDGN
jgi:hypothetical protein